MSSGMEPEVKRYLRKVLFTLFAGLSWLWINTLLGIWKEWAFWDHGFNWQNALFFGWLLLSLVLLLWYYYRLWKK